MFSSITKIINIAEKELNEIIFYLKKKKRKKMSFFLLIIYRYDKLEEKKRK